MNRSNFDDIVLDAIDDEEEEVKAAADEVEEEAKAAESEDEEVFVYDRALYDADGLEDEDVDFDDDDWAEGMACIIENYIVTHSNILLLRYAFVFNISLVINFWLCGRAQQNLS